MSDYIAVVCNRVNVGEMCPIHKATKKHQVRMLREVFDSVKDRYGHADTILPSRPIPRSLHLGKPGRPSAPFQGKHRRVPNE